MNRAFIDCRNGFNELYKEYVEAQKAYERSLKYTKSEEEYEGQNENRTARAKIAMNKAMLDLREYNATKWREYMDYCQMNRKWMTDELQRNNLADPSQVDPNAITLLNSGILTAADMKSMAAQFEANPTMRRLIYNAAEKRVDAEITRDERLQLYDVMNTVSDDADSRLETFDTMYQMSLKMAKIDNGADSVREVDWDFSSALSPKWETIQGVVDTVENF